MQFLSRLQDRFGFTRNEISVILFLVATLLAGLAIRWYRSSAPGDGPGPESFDYSGSDSVFLARSAGLLSPDSASAGATRPAPKREPAAGSIDLNSATKEELIRLPGIGGEYADRIIAYRSEHGAFSRVDDLLNISGIGRKRLDRLRPFVVVRSVTNIAP